MTTFDDRKTGHETEFAIDQNLEFKAAARRNKLLGLWAAELMGKSEQQAQEYAKDVIVADFEEAGDDDVFRKIRGDFDTAKIEQSDHQIRRQMDELLELARQQVREES
ncbi:FIG040666: hypothetical protein perhaps implicated in de Novo purine biosynthesis [hydrothermal vent metagenome]|uniref:DUF1476 domain-containing protein n=1 Tax=hydrothermal vent metagenome TaxID=652676 RepID=A0A3B0R3T6_9ZZZZ